MQCLSPCFTINQEHNDMPPIKWLPHLVSLIRIKAKTMTATQLAFEFGESRNAIIGLCRREEIPLVAFRMQHPWTEEKEKRKPVALRKGIIPNTESKPVLPDRVKPKKPGVWGSGGCLAILGEPKDLIGCCADTVGDDHVYCAEHHREFRVKQLVRGR